MTGGSHNQDKYLGVTLADRPPIPSRPSAVFLGVTPCFLEWRSAGKTCEACAEQRQAGSFDLYHQAEDPFIERQFCTARLSISIAKCRFAVLPGTPGPCNNTDSRKAPATRSVPAI